MRYISSRLMGTAAAAARRQSNAATLSSKRLLTLSSSSSPLSCLMQHDHHPNRPSSFYHYHHHRLFSTQLEPSSVNQRDQQAQREGSTSDAAAEKRCKRPKKKTKKQKEKKLKQQQKQAQQELNDLLTKQNRKNLDPYGRLVVQWTERLAQMDTLKKQYATTVATLSMSGQIDTNKTRAFPRHARLMTHHSKFWQQEQRLSASNNVIQAVVVDEDTSVAVAAEHICNGKYLVYEKGNFAAAKKLLQEMAKVFEAQEEQKSNQDATTTTTTTTTTEIHKLWEQQRAQKRQKARLLNRLLVKVQINKRRRRFEPNNHNHTLGTELQFNMACYHQAPADISDIISQGFWEHRGALKQQARNNSSLFLVPLRELQGMEGAYQWRKNGVKIQPKWEDIDNDNTDDDNSKSEEEKKQLSEMTPVAPFRIHPHYGVFRPNGRHKYLNLILQQTVNPPRGANKNGITMMDIGTGSGVITALMLRSQRVDRVIATDSNTSAIRCAKDNFERLRLLDRVRLVPLEEGLIFPPPSRNRRDKLSSSEADLIVCNPPWLPGAADSLMDQAVYDPDSKFLRTFLSQVHQHFATNDSEAWLVLSDLAERLGLRTKGDVEQMIDDGGLQIVGRSSTRVPLKTHHEGESDAIREARASEITQLYRLKKRE